MGVHGATAGGHEAVDDEEVAIRATEGEGMGSGGGDVGGENDAIDAKESVAGAGEAGEGDDFTEEAGGGFLRGEERGERFVELGTESGFSIILGDGGGEGGIMLANPAGASGGKGGVEGGLVEREVV